MSLIVEMMMMNTTLSHSIARSAHSLTHSPTHTRLSLVPWPWRCQAAINSPHSSALPAHGPCALLTQSGCRTRSKMRCSMRQKLIQKRRAHCNNTTFWPSQIYLWFYRYDTCTASSCLRHTDPSPFLRQCHYLLPFSVSCPSSTLVPIPTFPPSEEKKNGSL